MSREAAIQVPAKAEFYPMAEFYPTAPLGKSGLLLGPLMRVVGFPPCWPLLAIWASQQAPFISASEPRVCQQDRSHSLT